MAARLLPLNPEIAVDNRRRYGERATHRISQMTLQRPRAHPRSKNGAPLGYGVLMEQSGRKPPQMRAKAGAAEAARLLCKPPPSVASICQGHGMVRRGSTVRVRQRAFRGRRSTELGSVSGS